ncbi:MAG TPA: hypothetical protein ENI23_07705 [bacterium]|nr:hypothetical protein [bacterium]
MDIPKKVLIGGHEYPVEVFNGGARFANAGDLNTWTQEIRINTMDDHPESSQAEAFLHEIIEAINHDNELKLEHRNITILGAQLFAVIRNNNLDFRKGRK